MASAINSDNGVVSGSAGLKSSADSSGVLDLQTNGTTAISISASQVVTYTNQPTYTGGTANGVMYLNGSKAVTTGSALVFDGTNLGVGTSSPDNGKLTIIKNTANATESSYGIAIQSFTSNVYTELLLGADDTVDCGVIQTAAKNTNFTGKKLALQPQGGNVGIGTTTPASDARLTLASPTTESYVMFSRTNAGIYDVAIGNNGGSIVFKGGADSATVAGLTEFARIDSVGNLLVGRTNSDGYRVAAAGTTQLLSGYQLTYSGVAAGSVSLTSSGAMAFGLDAAAGSTERARITATGVLDLATGAGAVGQIQFPATQVASANANTLDDYEEGVYTPTVTTGTSGTITLNTSYDILTYTKIGRLVTITGLLVVGSVSSPVGELRISLPFTPASLGDGAIRQCPACVCYFNGSGAPSGGTYYPAAMFINQSPLSYFTLWAASLANVYTTAPASWCGSGSDLQINLTYVTAS